MTQIQLNNAIRSGLQSGVIMSIADITTQFVIEGKTFVDFDEHENNHNNNNNKVDDDTCSAYSLTRTLRWTVAGLLLHGPYFYIGFSQLDKFVGAGVRKQQQQQQRQNVIRGNLTASWKVVAQKTALAQFVLFPPYLAMLFGYMGYREGHPDIVQKIQQRVPEAFVSGCVYWPIANGINFAIIPTTFRIPYLAVSAGLWNSYLSWTNHRTHPSTATAATTTTTTITTTTTNSGE
jgi:hypothetical protein